MPMMSGNLLERNLQQPGAGGGRRDDPDGADRVAIRPTLDAKMFERPTRAATSKPMMTAAMVSAGRGRRWTSATGRTAGMTAEAACPLT